MREGYAISGRFLRMGAKKRLRVAGLMSGTSADGVDVAIVDIEGRAVRLVAFDTLAYPPSVRRQVFDLVDAERVELADVCHVNAVIGEVFASALVRVCEEAGVPLSSIDLVGSHGQTVHHLSEGRRFAGRRVRSSLQIGEPGVIAERTGITTVGDFRPRDLAAGGQGAPLVPYADHFLFSHPTLARAVQNIGGIANVTYLTAGGATSDAIAFDTGPGNMVIDRVAALVTDGKRPCDVGGRLAAKGEVNEALLAQLMRHPFLGKRPPKSTGREAFGAAFTDKMYRDARGRRIAPLEILSTVTAFTAASIARAYERFLPGAIDEVILCGGGAHNQTLVRLLDEALSGAKVIAMDQLGIPADAKEAVSFAILARETIRGVASNVPRATGAAHPVVLGKIVPGREV